MSMRKYARDYEFIDTEDENGHQKSTLVYCGKYYELELDTEELIRFKKISLMLLAIIAVFHISSGFLSNRGMYQLYVAVPYALAFFPLIYLTEGILRLPKEKRKYRHDEIGYSFDRMKTSGYLLIAFLGIVLLGEFVFLVFFADKIQRSPDYLYLVLELVAATAAFLLIYRQREILMQTCADEEQSQT